MNTAKVKKILMAIDRSGNTEKIITYTITLAKALGAEVTVFHVIDRSCLQPAADAYGNYIEGNIEALEEVLKKQAEEHYPELSSKLQKIIDNSNNIESRSVALQKRIRKISITNLYKLNLMMP